MENNKDDIQNLDWKAVRDSLDWDEDERQRTLMRQRAEQYAEPIKTRDAVTDTLVVLRFDLGSEHYGVAVEFVRGIRTLPRMTPVPGTPAFYRGVVNLRGQITTVLDLCAFFGLSNIEKIDDHELIIVQARGLEIGLLAQHVHGTTALPPSAIQPFDNIAYARGVTADQLVILDIDRLFEDDRLILGEQEE